jgi:FixJ family two-component response regulator
VKPILFVDDESKILDGIRRMPGMDGATLLRHIRDRFPSTARIASGHSEVALATGAVPRGTPRFHHAMQYHRTANHN